MNRILNIIVYYDNYEEVCDYINHVFAIGNNLVDVVIVVNKDSDNLVNNIKINNRKVYNSISIYNYNENVGYLNAYLFTIKKIDISKYKYIILSNTDIIYTQKDFFLILFKKEYNNDIGCIAPSVVSYIDGCYCNPHYIKRISKLKLYKLLFINSFPMLLRLYEYLSRKKRKIKKKERKPSNYVYSPHGCYMIFSKEFTSRMIGYSYGAKMFSEESYIGEMLIRNRMKCYYDAGIELMHVEGLVTNKSGYKKNSKYYKKSIAYILKEFY